MARKTLQEGFVFCIIAGFAAILWPRGKSPECLVAFVELPPKRLPCQEEAPTAEKGRQTLLSELKE